MHFLRFPVFRSSVGTPPVSGYSGIHEAALCCIHSVRGRGWSCSSRVYWQLIEGKIKQGAKKASKMRAEGKDYIVKDDEVMNFLFDI